MRSGDATARDPVARRFPAAPPLAALDLPADLLPMATPATSGLAADPMAFARPRLGAFDQATQLVAFAAQCAATLAATNGGAERDSPASCAPDPDDARHFDETLAMFVEHARGLVAELVQAAAMSAASTEPAAAIAAIRRTVNTLRAGFGVLNMAAPQMLCQATETALDACARAQQPFPAEVIGECADLLQQVLERLQHDSAAGPPQPEPSGTATADGAVAGECRAARWTAVAARDRLRHGQPKAPFGEVASLLAKLHAIGNAAELAAPAAPAADPTPWQLPLGGEFAGGLPDFLAGARAHLAQAEATMVAWSRDAGDREVIGGMLRHFRTIKGVAGLLNLGPVVELAHATETLLEAAQVRRQLLRQPDIDLLVAACDRIAQMLRQLDGQQGPLRRDWQCLLRDMQAAAARTEPAAGPALPAPEGGGDTASAEPAPAHSPLAAAGAGAQRSREGTRSSSATPCVSGAAVATPVGPATPAAPSEVGGAKVGRIERTIRVDAARLDRLVELVGELVRAQSLRRQDPAGQRIDTQGLSHETERIGEIVRDLHAAAMSLPMVPLRSTFEKMAHLARAVAGKFGKQVDLTIAGEGIELDRDMVEGVDVRLERLVRTAIEHGIESAAERLQRGKNAVGRLRLSASHQGGAVVIELADDGCGPDRQFLRRLVAEPAIEIDSQTGQGTALRLRLPMTRATTDGLVVRVGENRYVIPIHSVEHVFRSEAGDLQHAVAPGERVRVRGEELPVHRLECGGGLDDRDDDLRRGVLLVVAAGGVRSCLFVDAILGQQVVASKSLGMARRAWARVAPWSGGAIMADGSVALILDVSALGEAATEREGRRAPIAKTGRRDAFASRPRGVSVGEHLSCQLSGAEYGIPLPRVREVLGAVDLTPLPHAPDYVCGVMNLRGRVLPVLDLRRKLALNPAEGRREACVIVVDGSRDADASFCVGCTVDSVGEVLSIASERIVEAPRAAAGPGEHIVGSAMYRDRVLNLLDVEGVVADLDPTLDEPAT